MYDLLFLKFLKLIKKVCSQDNSEFKGLIFSVCELLWYVSPHMKTLEAKNSSIPSTCSKLCPLNDPTRYKHGTGKLEKIT